MFEISPDFPIEITHNVFNTNTFTSQNLYTLIQNKTQQLNNS